MEFPRQRMRFANTHNGKTVPEGYVLLDIKGLDIEGVNTLALKASDLVAVQAEGDKQQDAKQRVKDLLGGL